LDRVKQALRQTRLAGFQTNSPQFFETGKILCRTWQLAYYFEEMPPAPVISAGWFHSVDNLNAEIFLAAFKTITSRSVSRSNLAR